MKRSEVRQFIRSGVEAITPSLEFNEGEVSDFAAQRSNDYPSTLLILSENTTNTDTSAPVDSWKILIAIFQIDKLDSIPDVYEGLVDSCDEIAQKLAYKYRNIIEGYKLVRLEGFSRKKFIKSPVYGPDCLTGIELAFTIVSPDQTNVC